MTRVAFLGLGRMGTRMVGGLLKCGHEVRVFNRTSGRAVELEVAGAQSFPTPSEACIDAEIIVSMVANDSASREIWLGSHGVLSGALRVHALAIECSTLSHGWVLELSAAAARAGLRYIDAPVTGLPEAAAAGALTLLVGADPKDLGDARPVLDAFANRTIRFGGVGAGTAYKLLVNMLGAVQIASVAEMMAIAEKAGLDLTTVADALAVGQAASPQVVRNARRMAEDDHHQNVVFTPELRLKDVRYALALANESSVGSPFGALAARMFQELCARGGPEVNESYVIEIARAQRVGGG